jgi:hypothetical protein
MNIFNRDYSFNNILTIVLLIIYSLILTGCFGKPYSLKIGKINEKDPQQKAVITLSDPQIYQRETLINDRLREAELIKKLLKESSEIEGDADFRKKFTSQIIRDIETYTALSVGLGAGYNSKDKKDSKRDEELAHLNHQIAITQKRYELEDLIAARNNINLVTEKDEPVVDDPPPVIDGPPIVDEPPIGGNSSKFSIDEVYERNKEFIDGLRAAYPKGKNSPVNSTPQEQFRDLQAYRAELRQELAALNLDDLHDHDGNSIYRMQFRATIMPGEHKDKYGVTRLTVQPTEITQNEIRNIYYSWLNHITYRMNSWDLINSELEWNNQYAALESTKLFGVVAIGLGSSSCIDGVNYESYKQFRATTSDNDKYDQATEKSCLLIAYPGLYKDEMIQLQILASQGKCKSKYTEKELKSILLKEINDPKALNYLILNACNFGNDKSGLTQYILSVIRQLASKSDLDNGLKYNLRKAIIRLNQKTYDFKRIDPPAIFKNIISCVADDNTGRIFAKGKGRVYSANPFELSQRISTTARSANSLELALGLSMAKQTMGSNAKLDVGYIRTAAGNIDALERTPLVVGFADRLKNNEPIKCVDSIDDEYQIPDEKEKLVSKVNQIEERVNGLDAKVKDLNLRVDKKLIESKDNNDADNNISSHELSTAGWVFGPKIVVNPEDENLEMMHNVAAYDVSADFSIPGWWPRITLRKDTAWIGDWYNVGESIRIDEKLKHDLSTYKFEVDLPINRTDLDGLTNLIAKNTIGGFAELLMVNQIEPANISACVKEITFLIKGINVWRSTEVYMAGLEASRITVLPDMEGISATFDMDKFFVMKNTNALLHSIDQSIPITVWTRNGQDTISINLKGKRVMQAGVSVCAANSNISEAYDVFDTHIKNVMPRQISLCDRDVSFVVGLDYSTIKKPNFFLNGNPSIDVMKLNNDSTFNVKFNKSTLKGIKVNSVIPLSMVNEYGFTSVGINTTSCKTARPLPDIALSLKDKLITSKTSTATKKSFIVNLNHASGKFVNRKIRLGIRTEDLPDRAWYPSDTKALADVEDVKKLSTQFTVKSTVTDLFSSLQSGRVLNFALLIYSEGSITKIEKAVEIPGAVVFYKSGDEKIKVEPSTSNEFPTGQIKLIMPKNKSKAFNGLVGATVTAKFDGVWTPALKDVELTVNPDDADSSQVKLGFKDASNQTIYDVFRTSADAKKKDVKIKLSIVNSNNKNVPLVSGYKISKKK